MDALAALSCVRERVDAALGPALAASPFYVALIEEPRVPGGIALEVYCRHILITHDGPLYRERIVCVVERERFLAVFIEGGAVQDILSTEDPAVLALELEMHLQRALVQYAMYSGG